MKIVILFLSIFMVSGCATSSSIMKFTQSEIEIIPDIAIHRIFLPHYFSDMVKVEAKGIRKPMIFKRFEGQAYIVATNPRSGKEVTLAINDITQIEYIKLPKNIGKSSGGMTASEAVEGAALLSSIAILAPFAFVIWPFYDDPMADQKREVEENRKAKLVYIGLTTEQLIESIGEPLERNLCGSWREIWIYNEDKVLPGGKFLTIDRTNRKVIKSTYSQPESWECSPN